MGAIANLFGYLLNWLYELCGNYGWAIIIFSFILRLILMPLTIKQQKAMKKTAEIQEKAKVIQQKYKNNPEKMNQETMLLYKRENTTPFAGLVGCLSSILTIIIILSVFWLVSRPLTYMKKVDQDLIEKYTREINNENPNSSGKVSYIEIAIINKKSAEDEKVYLNMDFLGLDLSKVPSQNAKDITVYIIPVLYVITSFVSMKISNNMQNQKKEKETVKDEEKTEQDEALESMQQMSNSMSLMMPIMTISIAFIAPLGLALYWFISNVFMILERLIIDNVFKEKDEEIKQIADK